MSIEIIGPGILEKIRRIREVRREGEWLEACLGKHRVMSGDDSRDSEKHVFILSIFTVDAYTIFNIQSVVDSVYSEGKGDTQGYSNGLSQILTP